MSDKSPKICYYYRDIFYVNRGLCVLKKCCILGGCDFDLRQFDFEHSKNACIIAADKGYEAACKLKLDIDFVIGDFDSLGYIPSGKNVIRHNCEKDETDLALSLEKAIEENCDEMYIYGATGGRIDHSFANLQLICKLAECGKKAWLIDECFVIGAVCNDTIKLKARQSGIVSVFCVGKSACGVSINGLKYELCDYDLSPFEPIGVSNEFIGKSAEISVSNGVLLIMIEKQRNDLL